MMARIRSLKPNVTRGEAIEQFSGHGLAALIRNTAYGPLRSIAEFYIPFRIVRVEIVNRNRRDQHILGLDAVNGSLDLYQFEKLPAFPALNVLETRNFAQPALEPALVRELIIGKLQRLLFSSGFFRIQDLKISVEPVAGEIHVPYWISFRGRGSRVRLAALDAVRRRIEGPKVRHMLRQWLTTPPQA
jgi:hypothetical protein